MGLFFKMLLHVPKDDCPIIINSLETNCILAIMNNNSNVSPSNIFQVGLWYNYHNYSCLLPCTFYRVYKSIRDILTLF